MLWAGPLVSMNPSSCSVDRVAREVLLSVDTKVQGSGLARDIAVVSSACWVATIANTALQWAPS